MAKIVKVSGFDLSVVTLAFSTADAHASAFDNLTAEMVQWHRSKVFPTPSEIIAALVLAGRPKTTAAVYASNMLAWAREGKTPRSISAMVKVKPNGYVKAKAGAPKKTAVVAPAAGAEGASPMHRWAIVLNDMVAGALIVRDAGNKTMTVGDAKELQAALTTAKAVLGKYL